MLCMMTSQRSSSPEAGTLCVRRGSVRMLRGCELGQNLVYVCFVHARHSSCNTTDGTFQLLLLLDAGVFLKERGR